ncbi:unnamed protein product [Brassica oleracea var. botrytis]
MMPGLIPEKNTCKHTYPVHICKSESWFCLKLFILVSLVVCLKHISIVWLISTTYGYIVMIIHFILVKFLLCLVYLSALELLH